MGPQWVPISANGPPMAFHGLPMGSPGRPMGAPWAPMSDPTFRGNVAKPPCLPTKYSLSELTPSSAASAASAEMVQTGPVRTYVLHAPGAKMTVVHTNSLKLYKMIQLLTKHSIPHPKDLHIVYNVRIY